MDGKDEGEGRTPARRAWSMEGMLASVIVLLLGVGLSSGLGAPGALAMGDVIPFHARVPELMASKVRIDASRAAPGGLANARDGSICALMVSVMALEGGSFVLRGYDPARRRWLATWRGNATSLTERENCGREADILVHESDLAMLHRALHKAR